MMFDKINGTSLKHDYVLMGNIHFFSICILQEVDKKKAEDVPPPKEAVASWTTSQEQLSAISWSIYTIFVINGLYIFIFKKNVKY